MGWDNHMGLEESGEGEWEQRKCSNCFQWKPEYLFYRKLDGYQSRCKACNAEVVKGYRLRKKETCEQKNF